MMSAREDRARELFSSGYNCAQAVLGAFCEEDGLDLDTAFKLANGFGGGVRSGELCGAVSGAVLAIGLKCGFYIRGDLAQKSYCNEKTYEFIETFKEASGSILCRDLFGVDIRCPDDFQTPKAKDAQKLSRPVRPLRFVRVSRVTDGYTQVVTYDVWVGV